MRCVEFDIFFLKNLVCRAIFCLLFLVFRVILTINESCSIVYNIADFDFVRLSIFVFLW